MQQSRITGGNKGYHNKGCLAQNVMLAERAHGVGSRIGSIYPEEDGLRARALLGVPADRAVRTAISTGYAADPQVRRLSSTPTDVGGTVSLGQTPIEELVICWRYGRRNRPSVPAVVQS